MDKEKGSVLAGRIHSIRFALRGLITALQTQPNARIHAAASALVIAGGAIFAISANEWCILILTIVTVWTAEFLNTAFESLCDVVSPQLHPLVEKSKDVAAAAVLVAAIGSLGIGIIIFGPRIIGIFK